MPAAPVTRVQLVSSSLAAAVVATALAAGVSLIRFHAVRPLAISNASWMTQSIGGVLAGALLGIGGVMLFLHAAVFVDGRARAREVLRSTRLSSADLVLMAVGAGVGEELLFRAALQPLIGLWFSSVLFTAVHYWMPLQGTARALYAVFVFVVSLALGVLLIFGGLIAAMAAHAVVDLIVLLVAWDKLTNDDA